MKKVQRHLLHLAIPVRATVKRAPMAIATTGDAIHHMKIVLITLKSSTSDWSVAMSNGLIYEARISSSIMRFCFSLP